MGNNNFRTTYKISEDIEKSKKELDNICHQLVDAYLRANTHENIEYLTYLMAAIYLKYKEKYPFLSIVIPYRIKSDMSFRNNLEKELKKISPDFDISGIITDISGSTIVLKHVEDFNVRKQDFANTKIIDLYEKRLENTSFIAETEKRLSDDILLSEEDYFEIRHSILERIIDATYTEFTEERERPYSSELEDSRASYASKLESGNFSTSISKEQMRTLENLLEDLRSRVSDKLSYEILRETLPNILNDPLIKNGFHIDSHFSKDSKKPNGFAALYYVLDTPFGKLEFQLQSNKRYFEAKKGSAFHSGMKGKEIDIASYFELVDKNDEHDLNFYLDVLDTVPANSLISDTELPNFQSDEEKDQFLKTPLGKKYLQSQKIREYMKHIKLKDTYTYVPDSSITYADDTGIHKKDSGIYQAPTEMSFDEYLLLLAKSHSPYMSVCDSAHTSFSEMASLRPKDLVDEFSEVLRKRDSLTCLRHVLVERLDHILKTNPDSEYEENRRITESLPKEISRIDIVKYSEHLKDYLAAQNANKGTNEKEL